MRSREVADYAGPGLARVVFSRALPPALRTPEPPIPGVTLRAAVLEDVDDILGFWSLAAEDTDRPADRPKAVEALIARDPAVLLLAIHEEMIVGCVVVGWDGWRAHLYRLAVRPDHRRRGLATWLLTVAEQRLRHHGAIRIDAMSLTATTPHTPSGRLPATAGRTTGLAGSNHSPDRRSAIRLRDDGGEVMLVRRPQLWPRALKSLRSWACSA